MMPNTTDKKTALNNVLKPYLQISVLDELTQNQQNDLATYYAPLKPAPFNATGGMFQSSPLIIKELDDQRIPIYTALSENWNPYLETVFGVLQVEDTFYSFNEYVKPPTFLEGRYQGCSITLENYIEQNKDRNPLTETEALIFLFELCEGLKDLHKKKLFHGDISPQNILLTDAGIFLDTRFQNIDGIHQKMAPKIIDFDNTKVNKEKNHEVTSIIGTKPYAAPDILDFHHPVDQRADIYSLGCILGFMLTGISPKEGNIQPLISKRIKKIIDKCTATYDERFATVTRLQHYILRELNGSSTIAGGILRSIPGFRSHNYIKMAIACYFYFSFLFSSICMSIAGVFPAALIIPLLFLISVIFVFDVFHCMEFVQKHCYFFRKHHKLTLCLRMSIAFIVIYESCMILGKYL